MAVSYKRGFTLIELLVVIAIIGLLAAVVLASVGGARSKGVDASVKAQLGASRSQAELYASNNGSSYSGVCAAAPAGNGLSAILANALTEGNKGGAVVTTLATAGTWQNVTCHDSATAWSLEAPLSGSVSTTPSMWCVDSSGAAKLGSTTMAASGTTCP